MTDDIGTLLDRAVPTEVADLDMDRALEEGGRRARRKTAAKATSTLALVGVVAVAGMNWPLGRSVTVDPSPAGADVAGQLARAGCAPMAIGNPADRDHFDPATAPPAEALYGLALPSAGPHLSAISPTPAGMPGGALDVRAVVHNLEHGAIAVWIDTNAVAADTVNQIEDWATQLQDAGMANDAGGSILISPAPPGTDVAPVSFRAWGQAIDCQTWAQPVADGFVARHFGSRGQAPEKNLAPYPSPDPLAGTSPE